MKQVLVVLVALVLLSAACRKKAERENCYECYRYDSVSALVGGKFISGLAIPTHVVDSQVHCGYTEDLKNLLVRKNTLIDTAFKSEIPGDTVELDHWTMMCEIY